MNSSATESAAREHAGGYRRRLLVATALSLLLHALIAGGLATTHLGILSLPTPDGSAAATNIFKPKVAADFPLEVSKSGAPAAAHEKPLDLPTPMRRTETPKPAAAGRDRAVSRQESREIAEQAAISRRSPARTPRPPEAAPPAGPPPPAAARAGSTPAPAASAAADTLALRPAEAAGAPAAAKPAAAAPRRPPSERAAATAAPELPREVALLSEADRSSQRPQARALRVPTSIDPAPRAAPTGRRDLAAAPAGETTARVDPLAETPAAANLAPPDEPVAIRPAASAGKRSSSRSAASAIAGGPGAAFAPSAGFADDAPTAASDVSRTPPATAGGDGSGGGAGRTARDGLARTARDGGADGLPSTGWQPSSPGRSALVGSGDTPADGPAASADAVGVEGLADGLAGGVAGGLAGGIGTAAGDAGDALPSPGPAPGPAPWRRSRGPAGGAASAVSAAAAAAVENAGEAEALSTEGLSFGSPADLAAVVGGSRRGAEAAGAAPIVAQAPPARIASSMLPTEGRVREIAEPFANRAVEKRKVTGADETVDRGLLFLARAQLPDGRWSLRNYPGSADDTPPKLASDTAATGLALLSFLGAGHDHFGGRHRDTVRRGLEFLLATQKPDGDLYLPSDPLSNSCSWLYSHGIATMALCEAVGMTGDELVRPAAQRACGFITASQHPERGGWRYAPRTDADLSVSGWMLVALRSGKLAGVPLEPRSFDGVRRLLDASSPAAGKYRFLYNVGQPDQRPSALSAACMTAIGTLMRLHTGWRKDDPRVVEAGRALAAMRPAYGTPEQKIRDCYLWYYISQVLVHTGGAAWESWYAALSDQLASAQETSGAAAGSWNPLGPTPDRWGRYGGRIYVTTLHLLSLEVPSRHLPTYGIEEEKR